MSVLRLKTIGGRAVACLLAIGILATLAVLGVSFGINLARALGQPEQAGVILAIPAVSVSLILLVLAHECGHAIAAVFVGWRLLLFTGWRLTIKFDPIRIHWASSPFGGAVAGAVVALPESGPIHRSEWIAIVVGGVVANVVLALVAAALLWIGQAPVVTSLSILVGSLSLLLFISNLVPRRSAIFRNDGALLIDAVKGENLIPREHYTLLFAETVKGKRPRDWNPRYVQAVYADLVNHQPEAYQYLLLSDWHFDRGEFEEARHMLELAKALDKSGKAFLVQDALLLATIEQDGAAAQWLLSRVTPKQARRTFSYWLAMGAANLVVGEKQSARINLERAEIALKRFPLSTDADWQFLRILQRKAEVQITPPTEMAPA